MVSGYMVGWTVVFGTFVYCYYRKRSPKVKEGWFPPHEARDHYLELSRSSNPDPTVLRSALLRRAMTDITRIFELREQKPALTQLSKTGAIGDDMFSAFQAAEAEMELELNNVVQEAEKLKPGWGESIFQTASEMVMHEKQKEVQMEQEKKRKEEEKEKERKMKKEEEERKKDEERRQKLAEELIQQEEEEKKKKSGKK